MHSLFIFLVGKCLRTSTIAADINKIAVSLMVIAVYKTGLSIRSVLIDRTSMFEDKYHLLILILSLSLIYLVKRKIVKVLKGL